MATNNAPWGFIANANGIALNGRGFRIQYKRTTINQDARFWFVPRLKEIPATFPYLEE